LSEEYSLKSVLSLGTAIHIYTVLLNWFDEKLKLKNPRDNCNSRFNCFRVQMVSVYPSEL